MHKAAYNEDFIEAMYDYCPSFDIYYFYHSFFDRSLE